MKIYVLIFDTYNNGTQVETFANKKAAISFLKDWDEDEDMKKVQKEIKLNGYFEQDDEKRPWSIRLEECPLHK